MYFPIQILNKREKKAQYLFCYNEKLFYKQLRAKILQSSRKSLLKELFVIQLHQTFCKCLQCILSVYQILVGVRKMKISLWLLKKPIFQNITQRSHILWKEIPQMEQSYHLFGLLEHILKSDLLALHKFPSLTNTTLNNFSLFDNIIIE